MTDDAEEPIIHGGDLDGARSRFPAAPEPWIDLSTGINPHPWPLPALAPEIWSRLPPAGDELALRHAAAERYGVRDPDTIVSAPGTQALIQVLPRLVRSAQVAVLGPTYSEHIRTWADAGHDVREVNSLTAAATADIVVVVNPDNPTGRVLGRGALLACAEALAVRRGLLVVDEAFADALDAEASLAPVVGTSTIVLRSFGKIYGLAGLRLGFAITSPAHARKLRRMIGPWAVSGPALAIGRQALGDADWLAATRRRLAADADRLDALLVGAGCTVLGGTSLFRLVRHERATDFADELGRHGIYVRRFAHEPSWLRFGLPGPEAEWQRLAAVLGRRADEAKP